MHVLLGAETQGYRKKSLRVCAIDEELAQDAWVRLNRCQEPSLMLTTAIDPETFCHSLGLRAHPGHQRTRIHASLNIRNPSLRPSRRVARPKEERYGAARHLLKRSGEDALLIEVLVTSFTFSPPRL